tara:strand:- start:48 stop:464 length:417 start_codon:yes stop_codon:yes gene_type:complete
MNEEHDLAGLSIEAYVHYMLRNSKSGDLISFFVFENEQLGVKVVYKDSTSEFLNVEDARDYYNKCIKDGYLLYTTDRSKATDPKEYSPYYKDYHMKKETDGGAELLKEWHKQEAYELYMQYMNHSEDKNDGPEYALYA